MTTNSRLQAARRKFFARILLILIMMTISATTGAMLHAQAMSQSASDAEEQKLEHAAAHRVIVCVEPGDTLWSIAKQYHPGEVGIKKYVQSIIELNELESAGLQVGQVLRLP